MSSKLSKEPYKGVRDFYPEDMAIQNFIFDKWREVAKSFGYEENDASILEPTELYEAKTGEEIINEQTYTFEDRGGRRVTMRPEMTPSVARMIARKRRDLNFPVRWFSISNFFRYERPQKGRSREFWQLNCDIFGASGEEAEAESISLSYSIMKALGAEDKNFEIRINNRKLINGILQDVFGLDDKVSYKVTKLIDKKNKLSPTDFNEQANLLLGEKSKKFIEILESKTLGELISVEKSLSKNEGLQELQELFEELDNLQIKNYKFDPTLARGFDYYTGMVFEVYDVGPENNRSMFGGGRYDDLLEIFEEKPVPTVGFAMGDVTAADFLGAYNLIPEYRSNADLFVCTLKEDFIGDAMKLAQKLRGEGIKVVVNLGAKKVGDQISLADKKKIPFILCIGENEIKSGKFKVKNLESGEEKKLSIEQILSFINY